MLYRNGVPVRIRPRVRIGTAFLLGCNDIVRTCQPGICNGLANERTIGPETRCRNAADFLIRTGPIPGNLKHCVMAKIKKIPDNGTFHFSNLNPKGQRAGDCVIRAISAFMRWDWERTYRELAERGIKAGYIVNDDENYQSFLAEKGLRNTNNPVAETVSNSRRPNFARKLPNPGKRTFCGLRII